MASSKGRSLDLSTSSSMHRFRISRSSATTKERTDLPKAFSQGSPVQGVNSSHESLSSCSRCRRQKKKCSRTRPECDHCVRSAAKCSYQEQSTVAQLEEKIRQLTKFIEDNVAVGSPSASGAGKDVVVPNNNASVLNVRATRSSSASDRLVNTVFRSEQTISSSIQQAPVPPPDLSPARPLVAGSDALLRSTSPSSVQPSPLARELPSDAVCTRFVDAYFRHVHRVYPFINKSIIMESLQNIFELAQHDRDPRFTKLYLIMAIGCTTLQRAGQIPDEISLKFRVKYSDIVEYCLAHATIESIEILLLLSLYSLFDPSGVSPWSLVGMLTRQAVAVGITRRALPSENISPSQAELQHRMYWSVFVLDRMLSTSLGLPFGLNDENSDVPLPGITMEEFNTAEPHMYTTSLQICRHIIQLRQLEDTILQSIHLRNVKTTSSLTSTDKEAIKRELRGQVENWYSQGCLISPFENDNIPFHNSITWLTVRYYNLLILLYTPSHFNSILSSEQNYELQRFAQKYIQSSCILLHQRQLPLNWITLYRFLSICSILIYCFLRNKSEHGEMFLAKAEVSLCAKILEAFPRTWTVAAQSALVFGEFAALVANEGSFDSELRDKWFDQVKSGSTCLVWEVLGRNSAFSFIDHLIEHPEAWTDVQLLIHCRSVLHPTQDPMSVGNMDVWDEKGAAPLSGFGMDFF